MFLHPLILSTTTKHHAKKKVTIYGIIIVHPTDAITITEKIPKFKEKFLDLLRLLEGEYLYTLEIYAEGYDLRMVKKDNPDFAFSIHIQWDNSG